MEPRGTDGSWGQVFPHLGGWPRQAVLCWEESRVGQVVRGELCWTVFQLATRSVVHSVCG